MHIPDNYLSPSTYITLGAVMLPMWRRASNKIKNEITRAKMPLLGICSAFSFLIMMFNVPLPGGTTGHAVGATLVAILLGPYSAVIAVTIALAIQALFFGDGGILALTANSFNMAFAMPFVGYYVFNFIKEKVDTSKADYLAAFIAGYISLNVAALLTAVEFGIQPILFKDAAGLPLYGPYGLNIAIPAMMIPHMLAAGIIEGVVTAGVYVYIKKASPDVIYQGERIKMAPIYELILAMIALSPLGILATGTAWGEWGVGDLTEMLGFIPKGIEQGFRFEAPISDYAISNINGFLGYIISAIVGVTIIITITKLIVVKKKSKKELI